MTQQEATEKAIAVKCKNIIELSLDDWRPCWLDKNKLGMTKASWMMPNGQFTKYYRTVQSKRIHKKIKRIVDLWRITL